MEMVFTTPILVALAGIIISSLVLLWYAQKYRTQKISVDQFLINNQSLSGSEFANTFAATTLSLASTIIFFIEAHQAYGWLMGIGPLFFFAIQFYLLRTISNLEIDLKNIRTVADLWYAVFPSKAISRSIAIITVITILMAFFIELWVGSVILTTFLPKTAEFKACSFCALAVIVLLYVYNGGYAAIIKTDRWQLWLMILTSVAIVYFALVAPIINTSLKSESLLLFQLLSYNEGGWSLLIFLLWACIINLCFGFADLTVWQRMAASRSVQESYYGLLRGIWKMFVIFWLPMMSFILLYIKGYNYHTMEQFLELVLHTESGILGYVIFPLIVTGFATALFSTADSFMIACMYGLFDHSTFLPIIEKVPPQKREKTIKKYLVGSTLGLIIILSLLYYIHNNDIAGWIMPLFYAVFGLAATVAPLAIYAFHHHRKNLVPIKVTPLKNGILIFTLLLGWSTIIAGSFAEASTGLHYYSHLALLVALIIVCLGLLSAVRTSKTSSSTSIVANLEENHAFHY